MTRLVAVSQRVVVDPATGERRDALDQRWSGFLAACGMTAVPVPNDAEAALALVAAVPVAMVLFTGGNDIAVCGGDVPERDATERALLDFAQGHGLPVVGVCRGAQHLAHLFGGRLERVEGHVGRRHGLEPGGRVVNSYHNFAVAETPPGAEVLARAPDGTVEAFRLAEVRVTALMWHPERETPFDPADIALFRHILEEAP